MSFCFRNFSVAWVTTTLNTITAEHRNLREILLHGADLFKCIVSLVNARRVVGDELFQQWMDFDRSLIRLWESHAVRIRITYPSGRREELCEFMGDLLPETMKRGLVELVGPSELR